MNRTIVGINTAVIIDGDNLRVSLKRIGLKLSGLQLFLSNFFETDDLLTGMENMENEIFNPIIYIVSKMVAKDEREKQNLCLKNLKQQNAGLVKLSVVHPKRLYNSYWSSCTDSEIASFIAIALFDKSIEKIILVSGDGDFLRPLKRIGIRDKKICLVGVKGSTSKELTEYINLMGGKINIVENRVAGLSKIDKKKKRRRKTSII